MSIKLLGTLAPAPFSSSDASARGAASLDLVASHLSTLVSTLPESDHVDLEATAIMLGAWLPSLNLTSAMRALVHEIIKAVIACSSHFVRRPGIMALKALLDKDGNESAVFASTFLTDLALSPSHTTFEVVTCISETSVSTLLQGHEVIQSLWAALSAPESFLSESARCCFRSLIFSGNGSCLELTSPQQLTLRLDSIISRCLESRDRIALVNAVFLVDLRDSTCALALECPFSKSFHLWSITTALSLLNLPSKKSDTLERLFASHRVLIDSLNASPGISALKPHWSSSLEKLTEQRSDLLTDLLVSVLLRNTPQSVSALVSDLMPIILEELAHRLVSGISPSKSLSFWQTMTKFFKLLSSNTSFWSLSSGFVVSLANEALRSVSSPTTTKVTILSAIASMCQCLFQDSAFRWEFLDFVLIEVQACRYSLSWEVRDSVVSLFGAICSSCSEVESCISRNLHAAITSALRDSSEFVRTSAYEALGSMAPDPVWWSTLLALEPSLPSIILGTVDSQTSSRVSQSHAICTLLQLEHVVAHLASIPDFPCQLRLTMEGLYSDDDWDVRIEVIEILKVVWKLPQDVEWWRIMACKNLLDAAMADESRMVQQAAWTFLAQIRESLPSSPTASGGAAPSGWTLEDVERQLLALQVDVHYNPDDEVYPLAPGVADNDLDCPF